VTGDDSIDNIEMTGNGWTKLIIRKFLAENLLDVRSFLIGCVAPI